MWPRTSLLVVLARVMARLAFSLQCKIYVQCITNTHTKLYEQSIYEAAVHDSLHNVLNIDPPKNGFCCFLYEFGDVLCI